jgi:prepilin-type N-terminal cleavage/methylation domain-containing protein/prepilin-type processing-associated H-X9-DG protein
MKNGRTYEIGDRSTGLRRGFSLIELLVVIAIIGALLALALPAIHQVRERARMVECKNRLKQVGLALQDHQSQYGVLPQDGVNGYGIGAFLLPSLGQSALFSKLDPLRTPLPDPLHARPDLEGTALPVFRCPSHFADPELAGSLFGRTDYLGSANVFSKAMQLTDVSDGESNTIAVGETITDQAWALPGTGSCSSPPNAGGRFGSAHSGGAHFVMCDGAVRFINSLISPSTFQALGTPRGGEVVEGY